VNKILVIGCGSIGQRHIKALLEIGESNIAAYRTGKGQLKELDKKIKKHLEEFSNEDYAFAWKPTHIVISNPTSLHLEYLIKGIKTGANIFIEKPVTGNYSELENATVPLSEIKGYEGVVGFNLRFHSLIRQVKCIVASHQYGKVIYANLTVGHYLPSWHPYEDYRDSYASRKDFGGGVIRTLCHEIDLVQHFFGKIRKVFAKVDKLSCLEIDVDDVVDIMIEADYCKRTLIHMDYLSPIPVREGKILFEKGLLEYSCNRGEIYFTDYVSKQNEVIFKNTEDYDEQYASQMKSFINGNSNTACMLEEGIEVMRVIQCCEESSRTGEEICL
jgi:predicted dehydrogenase